ncbi:hypothetical protein ACOMHN_002381 [Nucella lapillus]
MCPATSLPPYFPAPSTISAACAGSQLIVIKLSSTSQCTGLPDSSLPALLFHVQHAAGKHGSIGKCVCVCGVGCCRVTIVNKCIDDSVDGFVCSSKAYTYA